MLCLPVELQLDIFQRATADWRTPCILDVLPDPEKPFFPQDHYDLQFLVEDLLCTLPTRHALTLVCRAFHALATPLLYQGLILCDVASIASISKSLSSRNLSFVRHLILDLPPSFSISASSDLLALVTALPAVHILSIRSDSERGYTEWENSGKEVPPLPHRAVAHAMARAFGPSLRKLTLDRGALELFHSPADVDVLTESLVNLEALVLTPPSGSSVYGRGNRTVRLPAALPRLHYLHIEQSVFTLPPDAAPTHAHFALNDATASALRPSLTHLSIEMRENAAFYVYDTLPTSTPGLVSLALSGICSAVTFALTECVFPSVTDLAIYTVYHDNGMGEEVYELQALVDAVRGLRKRGGASLVRFIIWDLELIENLGMRVLGGSVNVDGLEECGFALEDSNGGPLLDELRGKNPGCVEITRLLIERAAMSSVSNPGRIVSNVK